MKLYLDNKIISSMHDRDTWDPCSKLQLVSLQMPANRQRVLHSQKLDQIGRQDDAVQSTSLQQQLF